MANYIITDTYIVASLMNQKIISCDHFCQIEYYIMKNDRLWFAFERALKHLCIYM